jgi:hypothetical protein
MNKIIIPICVVVSIFFINVGLSINEQIDGLYKQSKDLLIQNNHIEVEISNRRLLTQKPPVAISKSFSLVINEIRYLESNSGTVMNLSIEKSQDNEDISNHYIDSQYRGIKKLPVMLQVDKFSSETDMGAVLNDIYQLEMGTDFKASEINKEGNALFVKGDVYGL